MNQWYNTQNVIPSFKGIKNQEKNSFTKVSTVDFYQSISKDLLTNPINFAGTITTIDKKVIITMMQSKRSLIFFNNEIWLGKDNPNFDVIMESFDRADVYQLVGLHLLNILKSEFRGKNIGLHQDNGLCCFENKSKPE